MTWTRKPRTMPTCERLHELFVYCEDTGILWWRVRRANQAAGSMAGYFDPDGYYQIGVDYRLWLGHRLAWKMHYGTEPPEIDHINGNPHDNRIANLRVASRTENNANAVRTKSRTGVKGVFPYKDRFIVRVAGKHVGTFRDLVSAGAAYQAAATARFGAFAYGGAPR